MLKIKENSLRKTNQIKISNASNDEYTITEPYNLQRTRNIVIK